MTNKSGTNSWSNFYVDQNGGNTHNFYPENFVTRVFLSKSPIQFLDESYQDKLILDLGCGHGRHIPFLLNCGFNVTGLEVSDDQVAHLQATFRDQAHFCCGSASSIPCENHSFDFVLASNSIYYLDGNHQGIKTHLEECKRVLKDGGKLIFSLLDRNHSLFDGAITNECEDILTIRKDFLGFRDGVRIQVHGDKTMQILQEAFNVLHTGEVLESVGKHRRHFHYYVASSL